MLDAAVDVPYTGSSGSCECREATGRAVGASHAYSVLSLERRGSERCGTRTIGTSSSQSQTNPGSGAVLRDLYIQTAQNECFQQLGLVSRNSTTRASIWKPLNGLAC